MFSIIKGFIGKYAIGIIAGVGIAAGLYIWSLQSDISELQSTLDNKNKEITSLEIANESAQQAIKNLQSDIDSEKKKLSQVVNKNQQIASENRQMNEELRRAKGRQDIVWQKPGLVERMIQTSYGEFADNFACITGAYEKCSEQ